MLNFKQYYRIVESTESSTLKAHLTHLEDLAVEEGKAGFDKFVEQVENFVNYLDGIRSKTSVNLKVDGSPALFFGIDPRPEYKGQFFIGTKTVFTGSPNLIHSVEEVDALYGDAAPGLKDLLKTVFPYFKEGYDGSGKVYQGDLLYSPSRPPSIKNINNQEYITFQPNLITYAIPVDPESELYEQVRNSKVGIIVHAGFRAKADTGRITFTPAGRDTTSVVLSLRKAGVFAEGSNYSTLDLAIDEQDRVAINNLLTAVVNKASNIDDVFNSAYLENENLTGLLKQYLNNMVREGGGMFKAARNKEKFDLNSFYTSFNSFIDKKIDKASEKLGTRGKANAEKKKEKLKTFLQEHKTSLNYLLSATYDMALTKEIFLKILSNVKGKLDNMKSFIPVGDNYITSPGEGHVLYIGDTPNQVKIVDRLDFSANNFLYGGQRGRSVNKTEPVTSLQEDSDETNYSIGFFGGGFNPPHSGHFAAAEIAAKENDDVYIVISPQARDESNITIEKKVNIWNHYKPLLEQYRGKIHIIVAEVTPVTTIYEYVATVNESPEAGNITINLYTDVEDSSRYKYMDKYSQNLKKIEIKPTPRVTSGTHFRALIDAGNKYEAFKLMPHGVDKEAVWRILTSS